LSTKSRTIFEISSVLLLTTLYLWIGHHRFVARDEGFYLMAAKLVMSGNLPYLDFFYPQMPLFPYLYGVWGQLLGFSWTAARVFASLLSVGCIVLLFLTLKGRVPYPVAFGAAVIFACSELVIGWYPTAQTYSATTFFCLLAYFLFSSNRFTPGFRKVFLVGVLLGLCANLRLFYLVVIPVFGLYLLFRDGSIRERTALIGALALGSTLMAAPSISLAAFDWAAYWFNNLGYHAIRTEMTANEIFAHRVEMVSIVFGWQGDERFDGLQFGLLSVASCLYLVLSLCKKRLPDCAFSIGLVLLVASFLPVPIYLQYFCVVVPFFVICTALLVGELMELASNSSRIIRPVQVGSLLFALLYISGSFNAVNRYLYTGEGVASVRTPTLEQARVQAVRDISREIQGRIAPGEVVLSQWPGYLLETKAKPYPGTENHFWIRAGDYLDAVGRERFKVVNRVEFQQLTEDPALNLIVIEEARLRRFFPGKVLESNRFKPVVEDRGVLLYHRE